MMNGQKFLLKIPPRSTNCPRFEYLHASVKNKIGNGKNENLLLLNKLTQDGVELHLTINQWSVDFHVFTI